MPSFEASLSQGKRFDLHFVPLIDVTSAEIQVQLGNMLKDLGQLAKAEASTVLY